MVSVGLDILLMTKRSSNCVAKSRGVLKVAWIQMVRDSPCVVAWGLTAGFSEHASQEGLRGPTLVTQKEPAPDVSDLVPRWVLTHLIGGY